MKNAFSIGAQCTRAGCGSVWGSDGDMRAALEGDWALAQAKHGLLGTDRAEFERGWLEGGIEDYPEDEQRRAIDEATRLGIARARGVA